MKSIEDFCDSGCEQYGHLDYLPILLILRIGLDSFILCFYSIQLSEPLKVNMGILRFDLLLDFLESSQYIFFFLVELFPIHDL